MSCIMLTMKTSAQLETILKQFLCSGVTVMLSLTVFMNIVSELMPITSDAVPLIGDLSTILFPMIIYIGW